VRVKKWFVAKTRPVHGQVACASFENQPTEAFLSIGNAARQDNGRIAAPPAPLVSGRSFAASPDDAAMLRVSNDIFGTACFITANEKQSSLGRLPRHDDRAGMPDGQLPKGSRIHWSREAFCQV